MSITLKLALRDAMLVAASILLWQFSHQLDAVGSAWRVPVAILAGVMIPVAGFLAHEWGHLIGARAGGSTVHMPKGVLTLFLFDYRAAENSRAQFLKLSCGGFVASGLVVALLLAVLSFDHLADLTALGLTLLGVIATFAIELPPAWRVYRGGPLPF
jgi:hypothetical protein